MSSPPRQAGSPASNAARPPSRSGPTIRPQSVTLPPPPFARRESNPKNPGGSGSGSGSRSRTSKPGTPTTEADAYPAGPLSPSLAANPGASSFIFPIRSVFQGMAGADSPQSFVMGGSTSADGPRSPQKHDDRRRFSQASFAADEGRRFERSEPRNDVVGIQTIAQMLQGESNDQSANSAATGSAAAAGTGGGKGAATFRGKVERTASGSGTTAASARVPPASKLPDSGSPMTPAAPQGFFSMPLPERAGKHDEYFGAVGAGDGGDGRRASDGTHAESPARTQDARHNDPPPPVNDSAEGKGSGLPDANRRPVGQPQEEPKGNNFVHYPGPGTEEKDNRFHSLGDGERDTRSSPTAADYKQSGPSTFRAEQNPGAAARRESSVALETDNQGEKALVHDFSGIVRLGEAGSLTGTGTGTGGAGTRSKGGSGTGTGTGSASLAMSGPTGARLAQQQRQAKNVSSRTVLDFVNEQAHTVNLSDPNAPAPSPSPVPRPPADAAQAPSDQDMDVKVGEEPPKEKEWADRSETSMSVRDSSEMATASGEGEGGGEEEGEGDAGSQASGKEEPILTLRFEHVTTGDGHHVVVGREGKLRRCEDEPITTPGAVQGFGVLVVLEEDFESGDLSVRQVSENSTELLGLSPKYLFRLDCFTRILTHDQEDILRDNIEYLPDAESGKGSVEEEGPQVFLLTGFGEPGSDDTDEDETSSDTGGRRREWTCWVAAHRPRQPSWDKVDENGRPIQPPDLIVLEFELERDIYNPLMQTFEPNEFSGGDTPDSGSQTTASAGARSGSTSSGAEATDTTMSTGSSTTVASTPRPPLSSDVSSNTTAQAGGTLSTRPSSKLPRGARPMGLEGLEVELPLERIIESTTNHAKPLRALERMRRTGQQVGDGSSTGDSGSRTDSRGGRNRRQRAGRRAPAGTTGTMDVFAVLGQINDQLGSAPDLETFLKITVGVVQDLCRFHRVLIYQFDETFNGQVVAELVEWGKTTDLFKGLMFPAADIPAQARELYKINKVRMLYDRSQTTARMVLRSKEDLETPLDMTHCYLRAMSPIHIRYLGNMHVRSSMSVSIMAFGQLWGLIACHSYGHHGMRVSFPVRQMMRILSDSISRNIERLSYAQRLHTRKLISTIPTQHHPTGYIVSNANDLLQIFDADSGLLVIGDGCKLLGDNAQGTAMLAIAEYLRIMKFDTMRSSSYLQRDFPDLVLPRAHDTIAGLLYVPLTAKAGQDFIVFLRKGQAREVQWAGKPYKDEQAGEGASLEPRKSFKTWSETVTGRSRAWSDDQLESAGVLALIYGKFIQVWREKQSAMASNQLTAILLSNTSHAVRTPLSQIINTLELALAGDIDADTRSMLENSHQASRALLFHVHDLLDLTRIETGNETAFNDPFDLRQSIADAVRLYQTESARRGLEFRVNMAPNMPEKVIGDSRKIKTVISNLVANSVKFTEEGYIEVYCGLQRHSDAGSQSESQSAGPMTRGGYVPIEIVISDSGCGIPTDKLEAMFVTLEGAEELRSESAGLGLGLAVVARIVEQLQGQLRAESEVGVGTRFFFTLQMLADDGKSGGDSARSRPTSSLDAASQPDLSLRPRKSRTGSSGGNSIVSLHSAQSHSSEIDSFVQQFGASHMLAPVPVEDKRLKEAEERMNRPGTYPVTDSSYPVRASKMDGDGEQVMSPSPASSAESGASSPQLPWSPAPDGGSRPKPVSVPQKRLSASFSARQRDSHLIQESTSSPTSSPRPTHGRTPSHSVPSYDHPSPSSTPTPTSAAAPVVPNPPPKEPASPKRSKLGPKGELKLRVMVVEDDAINSQILQKRLRMDKHAVLVATNGQEAVDLLKQDWDVDLVLMDIQMPIMDGRTAAKEIRKLEAKLGVPTDIDPLRIDGRIPIFAVSASLYESDRQSLAEAFDGWLLKPLDFARVRILMAGLQDPEKRRAEVYQQGQWERGGYLRDAPRRSSVESV